jgi:MFS family permease
VIWRLLPNVKHPEASRSLDYLGAAVFTIGISLILVGLTNKQTADWSTFQVGGLIGIGVLVSLVFLAIEARAKEPIVPLDLWRDRTYASSILSTFAISFGFFAAIIFLPRWFQVVRGESATASGYLMFPLLIGLIGSSIVSGQIVSRTGRYKAVVLAGLAIMTVGLVLMTQLRAETEFPSLWAWMFVTGMGIGPTLSVFTIIVQNAVPFSKLGVATSNLTFFRQIGGSVGLAIAGTWFGTSLQTHLTSELTPVRDQIVASLPPQFQDAAAQAFQPGGGLQQIDPNALTGVGQSFGDAVISQVPTAFQGFLEPFRAAFDLAFDRAMSLAIADTFLIGVIATVVGLVIALAMKELPLRSSHGPARSPEAAGRPQGAGIPATPATE